MKRGEGFVGTWIVSLGALGARSPEAIHAVSEGGDPSSVTGELSFGLRSAMILFPGGSFPRKPGLHGVLGGVAS